MVRDFLGEIEAKGKADTIWRGLHRKFTNAPKRGYGNLCNLGMIFFGDPPTRYAHLLEEQSYGG